MSKYIDADKLYEHLKQVDGLYPRYEDDIVDNAVSNVIDDIKTFINSLQQEHPEKECDELEDAANNYISPIENEQGLSFIGFSGQDIKDAFIAGAEWQYQKDRYEFAKLKAKEWCNGYDDAVSQFVKIPYEPRDWFSSNDGDFICGASFDEAIPAKGELYYRTELEEK